MTAALWRVPGFSRWLTGRSLGWFADTVMVLVLGMWVRQITGSSSQAGLTFVFYVAPSLLSPVTGLVVDRCSGRTALVLGNVLSAAAMVSLCWVHNTHQLWVLWAVTFAYGLSGVLLPAASVALQRSIVPGELRPTAQGMQQTLANSLQMLAPLVGSALFVATGGRGPALLAGACFGIAALVFSGFRHEPVREPVRADTLWADLWAGMRHVWRTGALLDAVVALLLVEAVGGLLEGAIYSVSDTFHRTPAWISVVATVQGVGMVAGSLLAARVVVRLGEVRAMVVGLMVLAVEACLAAAAPTMWSFLVVVWLLGAFVPLVMVASSSLQQRLTPDGLMGRVSTATGAAFTLAGLASLTTGALLVGVWSFRQIYPLVGAGCLAGALYLALMSRHRARHGAGVAVVDAVTRH